MRSAQLARRAGVSTQALRYYERRGLLRPPPRTGAGYRDYGADAVNVVQFIKQTQSLGFTLGDAADLLDLADGGPDSCESVQQLTTAKIAELDDKIRLLQSMRSSLVELQRTCESPRSARVCPLLAPVTELETPPEGK